MNGAQKVAVAYFLIALAAVLIVAFSGGVFDISLDGLKGYFPYMALFVFVILWETLLYYAHFLNLYVNGFGVMAIAILCYIFCGLSLNITIMIIVPIAAIMMAMTVSPINGGGDEQE